MSIVRVGTTQKYSEGWEAIFGKKKAKKSAPAAKKSKKKPSRKK